MKPGAGREWFTTFFDREFLKILEATKGPESTAREIDFAERVLGSDRGGRILDVACGYGRHAAELANRGYEVVGVDLSPVMIAAARRRWRGRPRLKFVRADMREMGYRGEFDAVVNLYTSFGYFSHRDNLRALGSMAAALRPGGRMLIDTRNRSYDRILLRSRANQFWQEVGSGRFLLQDVRFDPDRGVQEVEWRVVRAGTRRVWRRSFRLRVYSVAEWRSMFRGSHLRLIDVHGGYDPNESRQRPRPRLIMLAERAR